MLALRPRSLLLATLCNAAFMLGGCASEDTREEGGGQGPDDQPVEVSFASPLCQDGLCWVAPAPQGNLLHDAHTSPAGTTFAVGDSGVLLRWSGDRFEATALETGTPALLSVHALADDDVWIAGEEGAVLHLGRDGLAPQRPEDSYESEAFIAVRAFEGGSGWLASRAGGVFRREAGSWKRSFSATADNQAVTLLGMWAPTADEAWVLGRAGDAAHLYRFDGSAWSEVLFTVEAPIDLVAAGSPVAITGTAPGAAQLAFDHRVLEVDAAGVVSTSYAEPIGGGYAPSRVVDLRGDAAGKTWIVFESGLVAAANGSTGESLEMTARELGDGPDGRVLLLRSSGAIGDPLAPSSPRRAIEPLTVPLGASARRCAPAGTGAVCLLDSAAGSSQIWRFEADGSPTLLEDLGSVLDPRLFANATGLVVLAEYGELRLFDPSGERTVAVPSGDIEDVAVADDGTVYVVELAGAFSKVAPTASSLSTINLSGGPPQSDQTLRALHRAGPNAVFYSSIKYINQDQGIALVVRSSDGALLHDVAVPWFVEYPVRAVTASGVPYIVTFKEGSGHAALRLDGTSWTELDVPVPASQFITLTAFGEQVVLRNPEEDATIHLLDASGARTLTLPALGLAHVVPSEAGLFGVTEHQEFAMPGFSGHGGLAMFFAAVP